MATKSSFMRWIAGATLAAIGLWHAPAIAAAPPPPVPATLTQQGRILDKDGLPVSSKVHFIFTVYNDPAAVKPANVLWSEEQDITLDDGYFSTQLGSVTPLVDGLFDGSTRYLGVTVGNDDEMAPRQSITSVPYAILAGTAVNALTMPFAGLTGIPTVCDAGMYLKGFNAKGEKQCAALPSLTCRTAWNRPTTAVTEAFVGCSTGEVAVGGGCRTSGTLTSSYPYTCTPPPGNQNQLCLFLICQNPPCLNFNDWVCDTTAATTITAFERCCSVP